MPLVVGTDRFRNREILISETPARSAGMGISFRMIYDPLVSVKSEFGQNSLAIQRSGWLRMSRQKVLEKVQYQKF